MAALKAVAAQCLAWAIVLAASWAASAGRDVLWLAIAQGALAAALVFPLQAERWWIPIHAIFSPGLVLAVRADVSPFWPAAAFAALALTYWSVFRTRVPLFLSSRAAGQAVAGLLPRGGPMRCADLGSGIGTLLATLARARPDGEFVGIEAAPLPYLISRWRTAGLPCVRIRRGDFWSEPLGSYDLVYAFLSPEPMDRLWRKACAEMRSGALLVSNTFRVPDAEPVAVRELDDRRRTRLYCYRIPRRSAELQRISPTVPADRRAPAPG